jgi:hypothetical protein
MFLFFSPVFGRGLKGGCNSHGRGSHDEGHEHWWRTCEGHGGDFLIFMEGKSGDSKNRKKSPGVGVLVLMRQYVANG